VAFDDAGRTDVRVRVRSPKAIVARAAVSGPRPVCALLATAVTSHFHGFLLTAERMSSSSFLVVDVDGRVRTRFYADISTYEKKRERERGRHDSTEHVTDPFSPRFSVATFHASGTATNVKAEAGSRAPRARAREMAAAGRFERGSITTNNNKRNSFISSRGKTNSRVARSSVSKTRARTFSRDVSLATSLSPRATRDECANVACTRARGSHVVPAYLFAMLRLRSLQLPRDFRPPVVKPQSVLPSAVRSLG